MPIQFPPQNHNKALYIGLLSGTSVDGVDAGLFEFSNSSSDIGPKLLQTYQQPYPENVRQKIFQISQPGENEIDQMGSLDVEIGRIFAQATQRLLEKAKLPAEQIQAIGSHGQTIRHRPAFELPFSLQIGDPNTIAYLTGITTVADFRRKDIAAGGQGAPLATAFHQSAFYSAKEKRCVINIGGIANISVLDKNGDEATGYDTGPGNILMDSWASAHLRQPYDENGNWARSGNINEALTQRLIEHSYFSEKPPKSTGREEFNYEWLNRVLGDFADTSAEDVQASLCELTARSISQSISQHDIEAVYLCGGGTHNQHLITRVQEHLKGIRVSTTEFLGISPDWVESGLFAWLAKQRIENLPGNLPKVTGAKNPAILGGVYTP